MPTLLKRICLFSILLFSSVSTWAEEPSLGLDRSPSVDTAVNAPTSSTPATDEAAPTSEPVRGQSSYVYDLKRLIDQSKTNIKRVNEKIKEEAVIKRNQKREEKAREYYEMGSKLTDEGKFDEAREYYEKAIRITEHPEMAGYIKESQKRLKAQEGALRRQQNERVRDLTLEEKSKEQEIAKTYDEAVALYRQKKFKPAKEAFEHIESIIPDYKATQSYLRIIDQDIIAQDHVALKEQKIEMERQEKEAEVARNREKELWRKEIEQKEKVRKQQLSKQADEVYVQAVELYKQKKYKEAKTKFQEVAWVFPDYKATTNYLKHIDADIEEYDKKQAEEQEKLLAKQQWEEEVENSKKEKDRKAQEEVLAKAKAKQLEEQAAFTYGAAIKLFDKNSLDEALEKFNDIEKTSPDFKSTRMYIARIEKLQIEKSKNQEKSKQDVEIKAVKDIYEEGVREFHSKHYEAARVKFNQVQEKSPGFERTPSYLKRIEEAMGEAKTKDNKDKAQAAASDSTPKAVSEKDSTNKSDKKDTKTDSSKPKNVNSEDTVENIEKKMSESRDIEELATRSQAIINQLESAGNDRSISLARRKLGKFNTLINGMKDEIERSIKAIRDRMQKRDQEELAEQERQRNLRAEELYQEALGLIREQQFDAAKGKLLEIQTIVPNYKKSRDYLVNIDQDKAKAEVLAGLEISKKKESEIRAKEEKEQLAKIEKQASEERSYQLLQKAQEQQIENLSRKVIEINEEVIRLTKERKYTEAKALLSIIEGVVVSLKTLRELADQEAEKERMKKEQAKEIVFRKREAQKAVREDKRQTVGAMLNVQERRMTPDRQAEETADQYRKRDIVRQRDMLYNQGVDLYERQKYSQSRLIFEELKKRKDPRASGWISKLDRVVNNKSIEFKSGEAKQQTEYFHERLRMQKKANLIEQKERDRQKTLAREFERRQEDQESAKSENRRRAQAQRLRDLDLQKRQQEEEKINEQNKTEEVFRFKKTVDAPQSNKKRVEVKEEPKSEPEPTPEDIQREQQLELSNKRKAYFDELYQKQQEEKIEEEKRLAAKKEAEQKKYKAEQLKKNKQRDIVRRKDRKISSMPNEFAVIAKRDARREAKREAARQAREDKLKANRSKHIKEVIKEDRHEEINERRQEQDIEAQHKAAFEEEKLRKSREELKKNNTDKEEKEKLLNEAKMKEKEALRLEAQQRQQALEERRINAAAKMKEREELKKQEEESKQEALRRSQLQRQLKSQQNELQVQREKLRREMEQQTDVFYNQGVAYYKKGQYDQALKKFKDVEDVLPNYKQTQEYMLKANDAMLNKLTPQSAPKITPIATQQSFAKDKKDVSQEPHRSTEIDKTLDLFDPHS